MVRGIAIGLATITAATDGKSGTAMVTVTSMPVASVEVLPASSSVLIGSTVQLTATPKDAAGDPLAGRAVAWTTSDSTRARVSSSGLVTGRAAGAATITATSEGRSGSATVSVTQVPVATVEVSPTSATLVVGASRQLTATPKDANGTPLSRPVSWVSGDNGS
jgi:uncharacterized protein YjdB